MAIDYNLLNYLPMWCNAYGVRHVVICSGSRSAPLSFSFSRYNRFECHTVIDERSAGFIALGLAQSSHSPVVIIVTSGTAVVNLYPAVAEAYYSHTPLIILTADRPPQQINIYEGQSIIQPHIFSSHVICSLNAPTNINSEIFSLFEEQTIAFLNNLNSIRKGPIHLNIPFEEPFYPNDSAFNYPELKTQNLVTTPEVELNENVIIDLHLKNIIYIASRDEKDTEFENYVSKLNIPILADITSNLHSPNSIQYFDTIIKNHLNTLSKPDCIISSGRGIVSKVLKKYVSTLKDISHIYIASNGEVAECTSSADQIYNGSKISFFKKYFNGITTNITYLKEWKQLEKKASLVINSLCSLSCFSEFEIMRFVFNNIPESFVIHLANSMPVRWGQIFFNGTQKVYCNRGTSGIDGSTSTAIGYALENTTQQHILITGDVSFFYDINAFWQVQLPNNLKVLVLNNHGGGIFRLIDGPSSQPETESLFAMPRFRSIKNSAESYGIKFFYINQITDLEKVFIEFLSYPQLAILEIDTDIEINGDIFELYKQIHF